LQSSQKHYQHGDLLYQQGRYQEAAAVFRELLSQNSDDDIALNSLASCYINIEEKKKQALEIIDQAIGIDPEDPDHYILKSMILGRLGFPKKALKETETAIQLDPDNPNAFGIKALACSHLRYWKECEENCRRALALDPDYSLASNLLAEALQYQNKTSENEAQIEALLAKDPMNPFTHTNAGWAALQKGDRKAAESSFLEALRIDPEFEYAREGLIEAYKSRSFFYRIFLKYTFFMNRFSNGSQIALIIGFLVISRVARQIFTGSMAPIGYLVTLLYIFFVFWSWLADGVGCFMLLTDRVARNALNRVERWKAILIGANAFFGLLILVIGFLTGQIYLVYSGMVLMASAIPFSCVFDNDNKFGKYFYGTAGTYLLSSVIINGFDQFIYSFIPTNMADTYIGTLVWTFVGCTWLGAFGAFRRPV